MKKILIANRGEIAIRIAKSAKDLGLKTVGIFSEDDADSLHISRMDESFQLTEKGVQAYLDIKESVIDFKRLRFIPTENYVGQNITRIATVSSPFIREIQSRFSAYFGRQGQPSGTWSSN